MRPASHREKSTEILLWVYGVGLAGMLLPFSRELFITITPLNLLFAALFLFYARWPARRVLLTGLAVFVASFLVEAAGVNTGKIFGSYSYGSALGPKLWNTPVIIGLNWFVLIYCTNVMSRQLWDLLTDRFRRSRTAAVQTGSAASSHLVWKSVFIIITGSLMMVFYDLFLEPAAMRLDMWSWEGGRIPLSNYAAWFLLSVLFHTLVRITGEEKINSRAMPLFAVQIGFFAVIDIFYLL
jgi:putative membrane protein